MGHTIRDTGEGGLMDEKIEDHDKQYIAESHIRIGFREEDVERIERLISALEKIADSRPIIGVKDE